MSDGRFMSCPDFFDETLSSVKFADHKSSKGGFERRKLGGSTVLVWKPQAGIDDSALEELPGDLVFLGMSEEIGNLEKCKTGKVINQSEVFKMQSQHAHMRLIPARWVCARKSATKVRSRIVAKDSSWTSTQGGFFVADAKSGCIHVVGESHGNPQFARLCSGHWARVHAFSPDFQGAYRVKAAAFS